jgi:hypothetical protein
VSQYAESDTRRDCVPILAIRDRGDLGITMGIMDGGMVTPLSAVRLCGRGVPPRGPWTCLEVCT